MWTHMSLSADNAEGLALAAAIHSQIFEGMGEEPWRSKSFKALLENPLYDCRIYRVDDQPIGLLLFSAIAGEAEIVTVGVVPAERGKGYGGRILESLVTKGKSCHWDNIHLEVRRDNQQAIALYKARGFQQIGVRKNYYSLGSGQKIDAILMAYSFKSFKAPSL